jgi:FtsZ-binding cell division protein ZapB
MEEKTLEYYHLKIEQLLTSNESLNQEKSDLQNEVEALQERIDELEKEVSTYRDTLNFILEELYTNL